MNSTKLTYIRQRQQQKEALSASICELLKISDLEYGQMVMNEAYNYLKAYIPVAKQESETSIMLSPEEQDYWIDLITKTKAFWSWWRNHWMNRNEAFLDSIDFGLSLQLMRRIYKDLNSGEIMANDFHPHRSVLEDTYSQMIEEIAKETELSINN